MNPNVTSNYSVATMTRTITYWHDKDKKLYGYACDKEGYVRGFIDGMKHTIQRCTQLGIKIPDAELFEDDPSDSQASTYPPS